MSQSISYPSSIQLFNDIKPIFGYRDIIPLPVSTLFVHTLSSIVSTKMPIRLGIFISTIDQTFIGKTLYCFLSSEKKLAIKNYVLQHEVMFSELTVMLRYRYLWLYLPVLAFKIRV